jgi:vacuolar iron transporter family protein
MKLDAGSLSMAAGEYVSVSQQADTEKADVSLEQAAQEAGPRVQREEFEELVQIYKGRGLPEDLARQVAQVFTEKDPVRAHARDELGIDIDDWPNPLQAALTSFVRVPAFFQVQCTVACSKCDREWVEGWS